MGDEQNPNPNTQTKNQIYYSYRDYINLYNQYQRGYFTNVQNPYSLLLYAKAYYIKQKYEYCIKLLNKINKDYSTKILYERQTLLFKATYLLNNNNNNNNNKNIDDLEIIVRDYQRNKNRCPGKPLTQFHNNQVKELINFVLRSADKQVNNKDLNKQDLSTKLKYQQKLPKYEGMPSYIISSQWNKKINQYLLRKGQYPGPISNFELINHIFQLQPHQQQGKQYMDKLMFPLTQQQRYYVISKKHWNILQQLFSGYPIKRLFIYDPRNRQLSGGDNLIKTLIQHDTTKLILQWQGGSFWQKSIIPILHNKYGNGQLKQQTRNKDYLIIQPGRIQQPYTPLKYILVDLNILKTNTQKQQSRKRKIIASYDLQKYKPDQCINKNSVGLANLGNTCYMNSALQFLANLKQLTYYFVSNKYLNNINISDDNKDGSYGMVTCAFADVIKRMWFSNQDTRYIDPSQFKKTFGQRYVDFNGNQQQDAQQFLMFLLNCLHQDLNQINQLQLKHRQSMGGKSFDNVRNIAVGFYNRHYKSIISQLFHGFHYEQIRCDQCKSQMYRFQHYLMLPIQAPPDAPKITVFVVEVDKIIQAKKIDIYIKKLKTVQQAIDIIKKHFSLSDQNQFISMIFFQSNNWEIVNHQKQISYISRMVLKGGFFFIYQVVKPQPDQEIAMISFYIQGKQKYQCDGFPRLMSIKKLYKQPEYVDQITDIVFTTMKKALIQRDRKQYIKQIKPKKIKNQIYQTQYKVFMNLKIQNFTNVSTDRILGQNQNQQNVNLQGCLARMSKPQVIDQWKCQKCNQIRNATKTQKIYSVGKYLIIQIKRFTQNGKITTKIQYPIKDLNMKPFIQQQRFLTQPCIFNLQCVILHRGSLNTGHYTSICRNVDRNGWILHDDQISREIQEKQVVDGNAYILVYSRADPSMLGNSMVTNSRVTMDSGIK